MMVKRSRPHHITFGPAIPIVSVKDFSRFGDVGITKEMFEQAWGIVGPSVDRNMRNGVEMWQVITSAYLEGIQHGSGIALQMVEQGKLQLQQQQGKEEKNVQRRHW